MLLDEIGVSTAKAEEKQAMAAEKEAELSVQNREILQVCRTVVVVDATVADDLGQG